MQKTYIRPPKVPNMIAPYVLSRAGTTIGRTRGLGGVPAAVVFAFGGEAMWDVESKGRRA